MSLQTDLLERLATGLHRKSLSLPSEWAKTYRIMGGQFPGPWTFKHHPWLVAPHDATEETIIVQKAAQLGFTEVALNKSFARLDLNKQSVLYILPTDSAASNFSASRFDPALEISPHLQKMFSDVKNVGHKRAGYASLFVRGSRSKTNLKSDPVGLLVADELDEMNRQLVILAFERLSGQLNKQKYLLSTPTVMNAGINTFFRNSTQDHYFFHCPCCSRLTELTFPECLIITSDDPDHPKIKDSYLVCKECNGRLEHEDKPGYLSNGEWVSSNTDKIDRGFYVNQLYSFTVKPWELAAYYLKSLTDPVVEQELYNSKLGMAHEVKGSRLTSEDIEQCRASYKKANYKGVNTLGIDVGTKIHCCIYQWKFESLSADISIMATGRIIDEFTVDHFEQLDNVMMKYNIMSAVVDANPERRKALEFAQRFPNRIHLCVYGNGVSGKNLNVRGAEDSYFVTVDRTSWLDLMYNRLKSHRLGLPANISEEWIAQLKAMIRVERPDSNGNPVARYVTEDGTDDHFGHACNYAEIALGVIGQMSITGDL